MRERTPFPAALLERLPNLKLLLTTGKRNAFLDLTYLTAHGIPVAGTVDTRGAPGAVGTDSTTQHCVALILALARNLAFDDAVVKGLAPSPHGLEGRDAWQSGVAVGLGSGKTLGLVGLGRLGAAVGRAMHLAFGTRIIAWSSNLTQEKADEAASRVGLPVEDQWGRKAFTAVSKEELFKTADVISMHLVLSDRTRGIVGKTELALMKPSAMFVNTSRGPLVVERDLLDCLKAGKIRGAALDVFDLEPLPPDSEWRTTHWGRDGRSNVLLTPHMGYVEEDTMDDWYAQLAANVKAWGEGRVGDLTNRMN